MDETSQGADQQDENARTHQGPVVQAIHAGVAGSREVRRTIRLAGLLAMLAIAAVAIYFLGRVQGFDDAAASQAQPTPAASGLISPATQEAPQSPGSPIVSPADQAFRLAYGVPSPAKVDVDGTPYTVEAVAFPGEPALLQLANAKVLVTTWRSSMEDGASHSAPGYLSVHYFHEEPTGLRLASAHRQIVATGSFGDLNGIELRRDLFPHPTLIAVGGGSQQGCTWSVGSLVELTPNGAVGRGSVVLDLSYSEPDQESEVSGRIVPDANGYAVQYSGDVTAKVLFARRGETYAPVDPSQALEGC